MLLYPFHAFFGGLCFFFLWELRSVPDTSDVLRAFIQHALAIFFILFYVPKHFSFSNHSFFQLASHYCPRNLIFRLFQYYHLLNT